MIPAAKTSSPRTKRAKQERRLREDTRPPFYYGGLTIEHRRHAFCHADTRSSKATWLCDAAKHYPSTTYLKFILPTIRRGCTGDANRVATKFLQRLLGLTPDGLFGKATENALLKAQAAHKLTPDGICGPASWKAISGADKYI